MYPDGMNVCPDIKILLCAHIIHVYCNWENTTNVPTGRERPIVCWHT